MILTASAHIARFKVQIIYACSIGIIIDYRDYVYVSSSIIYGIIHTYMYMHVEYGQICLTY